MNQLCVDDDERAATLVAASSKWVYASFLGGMSLTLSEQILRLVSNKCTSEVRRVEDEYPICRCFVAYSIRARRCNDDDRP